MIILQTRHLRSGAQIQTRQGHGGGLRAVLIGVDGQEQPLVWYDVRRVIDEHGGEVDPRAEELRAKALKAIKEADELAVDPEMAHQGADQALCDLLTALGFGDVVEAYEAIDKWYG